MIRRYYGAELAVARRWDGTILGALDGPRVAGVALGRELVTEVTDRADDQDRPAYLMTSRPALVDFYRGFGFDSVGKLRLPRGVDV